MVHFIRPLVLVLSIAAGVFAAQPWSFSDGTLAIGPKGKAATLSYTYFSLGISITNEISRIDANSVVEETLEVSPSDTLHLTFTTKEGETVARPHQSFLLIEDPLANLATSIPVPVKLSGKAKLDLVRFVSIWLSKRTIAIYLLNCYMRIL
jgi:oligosaccharyltransferase complex subunit delta (ribophorin II)